MSMHPLPLLNPHCMPGRKSSATVCSLFWRVLANTFPAISNRLMPLQLSQDDRSPFFGMGTMRTSFHYWGKVHSCHTQLRSFKRYSMRSPQHFNISGRTPFLPPDLFPLMELSDSSTSSSDGGMQIKFFMKRKLQNVVQYVLLETHRLRCK